MASIHVEPGMGKAIFIGGIGGTPEHSKNRKEAMKMIANMKEYHTKIDIDEMGAEVYAPEPYEHDEMIKRSNARQQEKYNKYQAEQRNKAIHKANTIASTKRKNKMIKKSKKQNRRK